VKKQPPDHHNGPRVAMLLDNAFLPDPRVANEARSLAEAGYRVTILAWDRETERAPLEWWHGVRVERFGPRSRHHLGSAQVVHLARFWWRAFWRLLGMRVDAIHCHDFDTLPVGWLAAELKGCRLVYDAHESYADMLGANVAPWIKRAVARVERLLIGGAHAVLTVGELLAADLRRRGARRTWVVGNWKRLDEFDFAPAALAARRRELAPGAALVVAYIGWLNADRGIAPLLEAVERLDGVALVVGGDGPAAPDVRAAASRCPRIRYLGFVDPARVPMYTSLADAVYHGVDASNANARFSAPNKLFEALAAGKAVVCNNCGELGRIVRGEGCGVAVESLTADALVGAFRQLLEPGRLADMQARARAAGQQRYNWAAAERSLLDLYANIGLAPEACARNG